jgi:hypothetical protein
MYAYLVLGERESKAYSSAASSEGAVYAERFLRRRRRKKIPTPRRAATGMPIPRPTPRAVVFDFFAGSATEVGTAEVEVGDAPVFNAEEPTEDDVPMETVDDALDVVAIDEDDENVEEAADVWVCVYDSPMMVTVYTSAGD